MRDLRFALIPICAALLFTLCGTSCAGAGSSPEAGGEWRSASDSAGAGQIGGDAAEPDGLAPEAGDETVSASGSTGAGEIGSGGAGDTGTQSSGTQESAAGLGGEMTAGEMQSGGADGLRGGLLELLRNAESFIKDVFGVQTALCAGVLR